MIQIDHNPSLPIYLQIYEQIKSDIMVGRLVVGAKITSTRALAKELQIGRNTVENAYAQLVLEGYITSIPSSGYIVNDLQFDLHPKDKSSLAKNRSNITTPNNKSEKIQYNFQYGSLDTRHFPRKLWRKYLSDLLIMKETQAVHGYGDVKGDIELRTQLKKYLYHNRGVNCHPEQIVICSGTQSALEIMTKLFPYTKKQVAMEEPCYDGASVIFRRHGFDILPIPVDKEGIETKTLFASSARMVHIAPSHQFPMGAVMPINRRIQLLNWAEEHNNIIIEDDYDSEFRYNGRPIPSLQSMDKAQRVIYIGTFSKSLSPGLRIAYLILPEWLLVKYQNLFMGYQCTVPLIEQKIIAKFMAAGHWEKHIRKICLAHKKKHDILISAIKKHFGSKVKIHGHQAGLHILLEFLDGQQEHELVQKALAHKVKVCPVSPFWLNDKNYRNNALVLGYGLISETDIAEAIEILASAWFN